jgi:hypothetical protein
MSTGTARYLILRPVLHLTSLFGLSNKDKSSSNIFIPNRNWPAVRGLRFVACGSWPGARGLRFAACGSWPGARGLRFVAYCSWPQLWFLV